MDDPKFKATFWKPLGPNYPAAYEVWKSFSGNSKDIVEMLSSDIDPAELGKILNSMLKLKESLSLILPHPSKARSLQNLNRFLHSIETRMDGPPLSKAERKERSKQKELVWELEEERHKQKKLAWEKEWDRIFGEDEEDKEPIETS